MSQPKRYNLRLPQITYGMEESQDGEYVYHSDYAALAAENERLKASIQQGKWISDALKPVQSEESGTITIKAPVSSGKTVLVDLFAVEELKAENERLRKAGDAMADTRNKPITLSEFGHLAMAWNAAKEGGRK